MIKQSSSVLYKKQVQAVSETSSYIKRAVLKQPLQNIRTFNTYILNEADNFSLELTTNVHVIIPIVGALDIITNNENHFVTTEEVIVLPALSDNEKNVTISNPYENEKVHFILLELKTNAVVKSFTKQQFKIGKNQLTTKGLMSGVKMHIGFYSSKEDVVLHLNEKTTSALCYSPYGVLEVNYRLIDSGDAIAFFEDRVLDIEALSVSALIFVFEIEGSTTSS